MIMEIEINGKVHKRDFSDIKKTKYLQETFERVESLGYMPTETLYLKMTYLFPDVTTREWLDCSVHAISAIEKEANIYIEKSLINGLALNVSLN